MKTLRIAVAAEQQLPESIIETLLRYREAYPDVQLQFVRRPYPELIAKLQDGQIDVAIMLEIAALIPPNIGRLLIGEEQPCLALSEDIGKEIPSVLTVAECETLLSEETLILPVPFTATDRSSPVTLLREMLKMPTLNPKVRYVHDPDAIAMYVATGTGISLTNRTHNIARENGIKMVGLLNAEKYRKVALYAKNRHSSALDAFLNMLPS